MDNYLRSREDTFMSKDFKEAQGHGTKLWFTSKGSEKATQ